VRKPLIAGNWKMHGSLNQVQTLIGDIKAKFPTDSTTQVLVLPTFVHLSLVQQLLKNTTISYGAQNLYVGSSGAFTGEVAGAMLKELGVTHVLVGHSERRSIFHEELALIAAKFKAALDAGLTPILCVGETQTERENGITEKIISEQLDSIISLTGIAAFQRAIIAYEPVWAIGTGLTATPEQAQAVHAFIRQHLAQNKVDIAKAIRILYGGSMKAENAASLLAMPDIDGGLIGGASLEASSFLAIIHAAEQAFQRKNELTKEGS